MVAPSLDSPTVFLIEYVKRLITMGDALLVRQVVQDKLTEMVADLTDKVNSSRLLASRLTNLTL